MIATVLGSGMRSPGGIAPEPVPAPASRNDPRVRELMASHVRFVWRSLRRFGIAEASVEDAVQHVFWIVAGKLDAIGPGKEQAFLLGVAYRVAANLRRHSKRRSSGNELAEECEASDPDPDPEELLDLKRRRQILDRALEALSDEQRAVFVLFELEGLSKAEIAEALSIPEGTVASRLRRGRERFEARVEELRKRLQGATP